MRYSMSTRLLSLILAAALLIPCIPQGSATASEPELAPVTETVEVVETTEAAEVTEATEAAESTDASEETETTEVTEVVEETEATEATEAVEETEATEATEAVEETEATEATEVVEETEVTEATEAVEETALPHGFLGMPEGYVFSEENQKKRAAMEEYEVLETLSGLIPGENYAENQIMVSAETEEEALLIAQAYCGELTAYGNGIALITLSEATALEAVAASLDESLNLPVASPNYKKRIEPIISESAPISTFSFNAPTRQTWNDWIHDTLQNPDPNLLHPDAYDYQYMHDVVDTYAAWGVNTGESFIQVAVIDTGVDASHPDLQGRVQEEEIIVETEYGTYSLGTGDIVGHGTHVIGIIGASLDNAEGGAGIAPNVSVTSYRCADSDGELDSYGIIQGIYDATNDGAHVINMSLGGYWYEYLEDEAVQYAYDNGVTVVASMGNDGSNTVCYPAAYDHVIAVAATDRSNNRAWYSNYGDWCDISAPGSGIYSTLPGDDYEAWDGTSMAAPVVTGAIALYMSHWGGNPGPAHIEKVLESSAVKCKDKGMGAGIVNIANMLDDKPQAPSYFFEFDGKEYGDVRQFEKSIIPCETTLNFATYGVDHNWFILYTLDGKTPSVKDGQVVNGELYDWNGIDLSPYAGGSVTVKAMQVSGLGLPGKVLTLKLKVADSTKITGVSIEGPTRLVSGKKGQFTATVLPADKADQDVIWSATAAPFHKDIKIDKKGVLTIPKDYEGTVTVKATSAVDDRYSATAEVDVEIVNPVSKIALNLKTANLYVNQSENLSIAQLEDAKKNPVSQEDAGIQWTSSNPKVATVDGNGNVKALSKGKATITCKALDGSNKSAKCTVTVKQQVTGIDITGNTAVSPKESTALKAAVSPSTANTKSVIWSVDSGSLSRGVSISSSGKVSVPADYDYRNYPQITVYAAAKDGMGAVGTHTLTVQPKITGLTIEMREDYQGLAQGDELNKKGLLSTVHLFSVDLNESEEYKDNTCKLEAFSDGPEVDITWTSSNPKIVSVSGNGEIKALKAGTAKITVKALDGSKKTASVTIKVTNPVSYMEIKTSAPQMTNDTPYIGIGKSVTNTVTFGNTYGTPSNKKVVWDFYAYEANAYGEEIERYDIDWNAVFHETNLITIKNGKLTVKKDIYEYWTDEWLGSNEFMVKVIARSTDGTRTADGEPVTATKNFLVIPPTTTMQMEYKSYYAYANGGYVADFYCDQWHLFGEFYESGFIATSSNPKVASVVGIGPYEYEVDGEYYADSNWYSCYYATGKPGTAKITIKATDGSNKSCSFTVKVK